ncbi:MAG: DUF1684 domain-containing protein [Opitutaceae bacterium]|nr:DUF1684 domain-containing protein [Opitutaceae bacterium]
MRLHLLLTSVLLAVTAYAGDDYAESIGRWRAERVARLTQPDGWLSLVGRHPLAPGLNTIGSAADNSIRLAVGPPYLGSAMFADGKVIFTPAPGALLQIDGQSPHRAELAYQNDAPTRVTFDSAQFHVMTRGGQLFLRVRDAESPRLRQFAGLEYFPLDPSWRIEADWVPFTPARTVRIANILGQTYEASVPGKAVFTRDGQRHELLPIDDEPGGPLFFVLADATSGRETYGGGRFLYADQPRDGKVVLDFNRAQNPPCAFTPFATCPRPPRENHLAVPVRAGEKAYRGESP